ncbi:MAG: biotin synthase BioB, partial [Acidimicrobiales bacterium]
MERLFYTQLADDALANIDISNERCEQILTDPAVELMPLLNAAYEVRKATWGNTVQVHILNNAQNGNCPEDCSYCSQAKTSEADIEDYSLKPDDEILAEAKRAYEAGAFRYCLVMAGRGPSNARTEHLAQLVRQIKTAYPIEV